METILVNFMRLIHSGMYSKTLKRYSKLERIVQRILEKKKPETNSARRKKHKVTKVKLVDLSDYNTGRKLIYVKN